jgi:alanine racemase
MECRGALTAPCECAPLYPSKESPAIARARLTIDLAAIADNWRALDALSAPAVETGAVLKADAYGLGIDRVAPALVAAGARSLFVAQMEEGAALRERLGPGPAIYVFAGLMPGDAALVRAYDLVPCLNSPAQVRGFARDLAGRPCALQIDTGMNRLGLEPQDIADVLDHLPRLAPVLLLSHLACADDPGHPLNRAQAAAFETLAAHLPGVRGSLAATGGILLGASFHAGLTRPGIGLYGGLPFAQAQPVVTLALPVIQVREVTEGEVVGYGASWTAPRPARIATVSAGYADGLPRALGGGHLAVFAGDVALPVVGRVSMDLITVDVTGLDRVPDTLEILNAHQTIDHVAAAAGTIGYEILTSLGPRYERVYNGAPSSPDVE